MLVERASSDLTLESISANLAHLADHIPHSFNHSIVSASITSTLSLTTPDAPLSLLPNLWHWSLIVDLRYPNINGNRSSTTKVHPTCPKSNLPRAISTAPSNSPQSGDYLRPHDGSRTHHVLKLSVYFLCIFNTLPCILFLSFCFSSTCPPLTLLQLGYILLCFIVYFRIISGDLTYAFQSGVWIL